MGMESVGLHGPAQPVTFSAVPVQAGPLFSLLISCWDLLREYKGGSLNESRCRHLG